MESTRAYVKVSRARSEQRTRTALLDAAEKAFFAGAWASTSLDAMARDAGVTKQTLLRQFASKEGLLEHTFQRAYERVEAQRMQSPSDDIAAAVANLLAHYRLVGEASLRIAGMEGSDQLAEIGRRARRLHYEWIDHAFGVWLGAMKRGRRARVRAVLIALCDVRTWHILSSELGLSRTQIQLAMTESIEHALQLA